MENNQKQRPWFFSLNKDGDEAVVRLLHSTTKTIESIVSHKVTIDGKFRRIRCNGDGCPLCSSNRADSRIYVHLFDYTDNKEKVWERTDKIIPQLDKLLESWNPLHSAVVKITRKGNEFPKYDVVPLNPMSYSQVEDSLVDESIAKFYSTKRTNEDISVFLQTGSLPERKPFVPKEEYFKNKKSGANNPQDSTSVKAVNEPKKDVFDPFAY
jgi:hypothetical protein